MTTWSLDQRVQQSRKKRGHSLPFDRRSDGIVHYELVHHPIESSMPERVLAYEAMMNETTLDEWILRNRIGGRITGREIYLPRTFSVAPLDRDPFNTSCDNLHCFESKSERMKWNHGKFTLLDNKAKIKELSVEYSRRQVHQRTHRRT